MNKATYRKFSILRNYNNLCKRIDDLACDYCELLTKATKINQTLRDDVSPANHDNQSKVESVTILLAEKKKRLERAIEEKNKIDAALKALGVRDEYIIRKTCVNTYSLYSVSKELKLNYKYTIGLRQRLLTKLKL
jgi:hypothetical protein